MCPDITRTKAYFPKRRGLVGSVDNRRYSVCSGKVLSIPLTRVVTRIYLCLGTCPPPERRDHRKKGAEEEERY